TPRQRTGDSVLSDEAPAWVTSLLVHLGILLSMMFVAAVVPVSEELVILIDNVAMSDDPLATSQDLQFSDAPQGAIGAPGQGDPDAIATQAPTLGVVAALPSQLVVDESPQATQHVAIQEEINLAKGPKFAENLVVKGVAGVGAVGATGAVDRITQEIILA